MKELQSIEHEGEEIDPDRLTAEQSEKLNKLEQNFLRWRAGKPYDANFQKAFSGMPEAHMESLEMGIKAKLFGKWDKDKKLLRNK